MILFYTNSDNGGVHTNSGIPNKAATTQFVVLVKQRSEQIYYRALTVYLTSNSNFQDAKASLQQAAFDLYGDGIAQQVKVKHGTVLACRRTVLK